MTWKQIIKLAETEYGLTEIFYVYDKQNEWLGNCSYTDGIIELNFHKLKTKESRISALFHELGHIFCFKNDVWKYYHHECHESKLTKVEKRKALRTGLKAERWVEKWAEKEVKKYFPHIVYMKGYQTKRGLELFEQVVLSGYR